MSELLLDLYPVRLTVHSGGTELSIGLDGQTRSFQLAWPIESFWIAPVQPYQREYQIDGSDSVNNFTLDPEYFAALAPSPYYRLQAWLRDEASYSRWQNLVVRDDETGALALRADRPPAGRTELPRRFTWSIELHRLEAPRTVRFFGADGTALEITINRNDKFVRLTEAGGTQPERELARWFFPRDWVPAAAQVGALILRAGAIALALALLLTPVARVLPGRSIGRPGRRLGAIVAGLALATVLAAGSVTSVVLFDRAPHIVDAISYYFQAKILASGALAAPAPPVPAAFPTPFTVIHDGQWFSLYPPGAPLTLALGFRLGMPWLVQPLLAVAAAWLIYRVGQVQFGAATALVALVLLASSPFLHLMSGSFLSHVPALFGATAFLYAATRYRARPARRWAALAALALGGTFLVRETVAVLYGLVVGLFLTGQALRYPGWIGWRRARLDRLIDGAICLGCLAAVGFLYLAYNGALTGAPFLLPRHLFDVRERIGFGEGVGFYGQHTLASGLVNADQLLTSLTISLLGWPFYLSLALIALPFLLGRATRWDWLHGAIFGAFVLTYLAYYYHGIVFGGPRYYFEALPSLILLTARGFTTLGAELAQLLSRLGRAAARPRALNATLALGGALLACNLLYFTPRQIALYQGFSDYPRSNPVLGDFVRRDLTGRVAALSDAIVTTDDRWIYAVYLAPLNCPRLDCTAVFAYRPDDATAAGLRAAFPNRTWYTVHNRDGRLEIEPDLSEVHQ